MNATQVIQQMGLQPLHGEGGFFRRTYTSIARQSASRAAGSAIYYLITADHGSALHRLREADEVFHYYAGDAVEMITWEESSLHPHFPALGNRLHLQETPQVLIQAGTWQGLRLRPGGSWALLGTTVCPEYLDDDFELATKERFSHLSTELQSALFPWIG